MTVHPALEAIGELPLFDGLSEEQLQVQRRLWRCTTFPSRTNLIMVQQPGEIVYIIWSGSVRIHVEQADGSDVILAFGGPGDIEGEMSLFSTTERTANVVTNQESTVLWLHKAAFNANLLSTPQLAFNLLRILAERLRLANERIQALCSLDIDGRVARQLLALARQYGRPDPGGGTLIPIRLTQSDLASLVGATRERVNQILTIYKRQHLLSVDRQARFVINDAAALERRYL